MFLTTRLALLLFILVALPCGATDPGDHHLQGWIAAINSARDDGYLFLPGLISRERVLAARRAIVPSLDALGWLRRDGDNDWRALANVENFVADTDPVVSDLTCRHAVLPE